MNDLTALILTYNEQENISRTLDSISWVQKILIVDSYSTDETVKLAGSYPNVSVVQRAFDSFAGQCQFGLSQIGSFPSMQITPLRLRSPKKSGPSLRKQKWPAIP
jgi:glycosyltransferase involved in cell wall biosynthesis